MMMLMKQDRLISIFVLVAFVCAALAAPVEAKSKSKNYKKSSYSKSYRRYVPQFSALVVDAQTGRVLYEKNASATRYPASLTKMMTLYMTFDALKKGRLRMDTPMPVSKKAASQPQTNIRLDKGDTLTVQDAIESLVVRSANDSAMVLAEKIGGTEWNFAMLMTKKARELGMKNTVFKNPNGLPDSQQYTTAYDMARLGIALRRDFPEYYPFFKQTVFTHDGVTYTSHNHMLDRFDWVDGIKTGYIRASGFNLVTSAKKNGHRLVAVIIGGKSADARDDAMVSLLENNFAKLDNALAANDNVRPATSVTYRPPQGQSTIGEGG